MTDEDKKPKEENKVAEAKDEEKVKAEDDKEEEKTKGEDKKLFSKSNSAGTITPVDNRYSDGRFGIKCHLASQGDIFGSNCWKDIIHILPDHRDQSLIMLDRMLDF